MTSAQADFWTCAGNDRRVDKGQTFSIYHGPVPEYCPIHSTEDTWTDNTGQGNQTGLLMQLLKTAPLGDIKKISLVLAFSFSAR